MALFHRTGSGSGHAHENINGLLRHTWRTSAAMTENYGLTLGVNVASWPFIAEPAPGVDQYTCDERVSLRAMLWLCAAVHSANTWRLQAIPQLFTLV